MDDLISRQAAIDAIRKDMYADTDYLSSLICDGISDVLNGLPAADAVPVVRCKDCRYWDTFPSSSLAPEFHKCKGLGVHTVADFFCSKGEEN